VATSLPGSSQLACYAPAGGMQGFKSINGTVAVKEELPPGMKIKH
jgi:hypothetical protein